MTPSHPAPALPPLPQLGERFFITDGGLETTLCFHHQIKLPEFAAYVLLRDEKGRELLLSYYRNYANLAREHGLGLILETATWRASRDWGARIGDGSTSLAALNLAAVDLVKQVRDEFAAPQTPIVLSGNIGPRGDAYVAARAMNPEQARDYHAKQIRVFRMTGVDLVTAMTLNYIEEAIGIVLAAQDAKLPVCISFTVETDGHLPTGQSIANAIAVVDDATDYYAAYYMINCAHPSHFHHLFAQGDPALQRVRGIRANASKLSHAELGKLDRLDDGNPEEFGQQLVKLAKTNRQITILGGCCGTDLRHIVQVCQQLD